MAAHVFAAALCVLAVVYASQPSGVLGADATGTLQSGKGTLVYVEKGTRDFHIKPPDGGAVKVNVSAADTREPLSFGSSAAGFDARRVLLGLPTMPR